MEQYKCFLYTAYQRDWLGKKSVDELFSDELNRMITEWATDMIAKHPNFRYRIVNASHSDRWPQAGGRSDTLITATVHVAYEI